MLHVELEFVFGSHIPDILDLAPYIQIQDLGRRSIIGGGLWKTRYVVLWAFPLGRGADWGRSVGSGIFFCMFSWAHAGCSRTGVRRAISLRRGWRVASGGVRPSGWGALIAWARSQWVGCGRLARARLPKQRKELLAFGLVDLLGDAFAFGLDGVDQGVDHFG